MPLLNGRELFELVIMIVGLGYIFMGSFQQPRTITDYLQKFRFDWKAFSLAILITAPAIVLHELAHKFMALFLGLYAQFHASFYGLGIGVVLRLIQSPFIVFVPGYVSICGDVGCTTGVPALSSAITAFVGPGMNLLLFVIAYFVLRSATKLTMRQKMLWYATKQINLFLFFFNMIPIPPFDGFGVVRGLFSAFS